MCAIRSLVCTAPLLSLLAAAPLAGAQGVGSGVKTGFLHSSMVSSSVLDSGSGWMAGLFIGGNRSGPVGVMTEFNILSTNTTGTATYHLQIPAMLRINIGLSSVGVPRALVYGIAGPALHLTLGNDLRDVRGVEDIESIDTSVVIGIGVEIARFIVEVRGTRGLRNLATQAEQLELKSTTFALLAGLRFN